MSIRQLWIIGLAVPAALWAPAGAQEATIDFETEIQPIFTANCALSGCHKAPNPAAGQNLSEGNAFAALVGVTSSRYNRVKVIPGNSSESLIILKLEGDSRVGSRMPLGRTPLPAETIQLIKDWIDQGALAELPDTTAVEAMGWSRIKRLVRELLE